jgi:hypothetical protein
MQGSAQASKLAGEMVAVGLFAVYAQPDQQLFPPGVVT